MQLRSRASSVHTMVASLALPFTVLAGANTRAETAPSRDLLGDKPVLHVTTFEAAPAVDGVLDDEAWATAEAAGPFWHFQTGAPARQDTRAWMGLDKENLYAAFRCAEAEMGKLKVEPLHSLHGVQDMLADGMTLGEIWYNTDEDELVRGGG